MRQFELPPHKYREKRRAVVMKEFGYIDPATEEAIEQATQHYADAKAAYKRSLMADFDPYTDDPNCKTCQKGKTS